MRISIVKNKSGQGLTEYLMLMILVAVISIGAVRAVGNTISEKFKRVREQIWNEIDFDQRARRN